MEDKGLSPDQQGSLCTPAFTELAVLKKEPEAVEARLFLFLEANANRLKLQLNELALRQAVLELTSLDLKLALTAEVVSESVLSSFVQLGQDLGSTNC